jgi:uncharacterized protein (TIRG00374 family)
MILRASQENNTVFTFIKVLVFAISCFVIWLHLSSKADLLHDSQKIIFTAFNARGVFYLFIIILLMVMNWSFEALKWKLLLQNIQDITFLRSLRAVLSGVTVSFFTPNRMGEFAGRILYLEQGNKIKGAMATFVGSTAQLLITLQFGFVAFTLIGPQLVNIDLKLLYTYDVLLCILFFVLTFLWIHIADLSRILSRITILKKFEKITNIFGNFKRRELAYTYLLSFLRYVIFCTQQFLLLKLFNADVNYLFCFLLSGLSFLIITIIPSIAIGELGVRGSVNLTVFALANIDASLILIATFSLWLINLAFPAFIGSFGFLFVKFRSIVNFTKE